MGGDPLTPQVERNILGLDLDSDSLAQAAQRVIDGAGSHGHRILKIKKCKSFFVSVIVSFVRRSRNHNLC